MDGDKFTINQSQILELCLGIQSLLAQVRDVGGQGVVDALDAPFAGSAQLLHLSGTKTLQQDLGGSRHQRDLWRRREQQTLRSGYRPWKTHIHE